MQKITSFLLRFLVIFSILTYLMLILCAFVPISGEGAVYSETLRLHVIANSDDDADQSLKLKVRDAVLDTVGAIAADAKSADEAAAAVNLHLDEIKKAAEKVVSDSGFAYGVEVELGIEHFPTREYDGVRLPAGEYTALRLLIGDAAGKHWWCVLYPALCTAAAEPRETLAEAGFTSAQIRLLTDSETPRYALRFRLLEWLGELWNK